jgi:hypothetical protein
MPFGEAHVHQLETADLANPDLPSGADLRLNVARRTRLPTTRTHETHAVDAHHLASTAGRRRDPPRRIVFAEALMLG